MPDKIKIVIVEDEPRSLSTLTRMLEMIADIEVIGIAKNVKDAISCINEVKPDLVFLDVQLPDGDGFEVIELTEYKSFKVIFITAHDQYAVKAFEFAAIDYLMKPFGPQKLEQAIDRFKNSRYSNDFKVQLSVLKESLKNNFQKIILPSLKGAIIADIDDVIRCEASESYTLFYMIDKSHYLVTKNLGKIEEILSDLNFFRVHKKHFINLKYIMEYEKGKGGYIILKDKTAIPLSVNKKKEFFDRMKTFAKKV